MLSSAFRSSFVSIEPTLSSAFRSSFSVVCFVCVLNNRLESPPEEWLSTTILIELERPVAFFLLSWCISEKAWCISCFRGTFFDKAWCNARNRDAFWKTVVHLPESWCNLDQVPLHMEEALGFTALLFPELFFFFHLGSQ